ncbi:hypothetical protein GCM10023169_41670 [Georgenia halophila]|uniref:DoxX protein n=1 Tax=Georgenia halophila TaxID=620889 RepID=A0ABP8LSF4_9MICO
MGLPIKLSHVPIRAAAGSFILNAGLGKRELPEDSAAGMQSMGANAFPQLKDVSPNDFGKLLSTSEIALGSALLTPFVPSWLVGLGLAGFSGSLLRMYTKTPGLTEEGSKVKPTSEGTPIAKDVFLLGIALTLILDDLVSRKK